MVYTCNYWGSISSDYLNWACTFAARKPTSFGFGKVGMYASQMPRPGVMGGPHGAGPAHPGFGPAVLIRAE